MSMQQKGILSVVLTGESTKEKEGKSAKGKEGKSRYKGDMPTRETGDETAQDNMRGTTQGVEADPRDMSLQARQQLLNEQGGEKCICGGWEDFARVDGGWAPSNMRNEWGEAGDYGCENIAGGDSVICAKLCLPAVPGRASGRVRRDWRAADSSGTS